MPVDPKDSAASLATLYQKITIPTYFAKLASYGIQPETDEDAERLLTIGHQLMRAEGLAHQKQAADRGGFLDAAANALAYQLGDSAPRQKQAAEDSWVKQASQAFAQDADVAAAAAQLAVALQETR